MVSLATEVMIWSSAAWARIACCGFVIGVQLVPLKELGKQEVVAPESKAAVQVVLVAAVVVVTGHCVAAVLNAVKAGVLSFGVKLVSGANRTVLW